MCLSVSGLWPVFTGDKPYITHTFGRDLRSLCQDYERAEDNCTLGIGAIFDMTDDVYYH